MADFWIGFALCWLIASALMWRMLASVVSSSPAVRLGFALIWPVILWKEGR